MRSNLASAITATLFGMFVYFGHRAGWFDLLLYGTLRIPDLMSAIRALVALAALIGWSMRNEFGGNGHG